MHILDSHFHWWPRSFFEDLCKRSGYPRAQDNGRGGSVYFREKRTDDRPWFDIWAEWFDLDAQLAHMDQLGHRVDVVSSIGPFSVHFSDLPVEEGNEAARAWNEEMARAQRKHAGRVWATAAVPLKDTGVAIDVLDHAINKLGLVGANLPRGNGACRHRY